jgi:hypothetical protein
MRQGYISSLRASLPSSEQQQQQQHRHGKKEKKRKRKEKQNRLFTKRRKYSDWKGQINTKGASTTTRETQKRFALRPDGKVREIKTDFRGVSNALWLIKAKTCKEEKEMFLTV